MLTSNLKSEINIGIMYTPFFIRISFIWINEAQISKI